MSEEKMKKLFADARAWDPVDQKLLDRVAQRLENRRSNWLLPLAASIAAALVAFAISRTDPPVELEPAPRISKAKPMVYAPREERSIIPSRRMRPAPPKAPAIEAPIVEEQIVEEQIAIVPAIEPKLPPGRSKRYVPRAIVEFQQIDWRSLEQSDELPAYVQSIIAKRDGRALLAALDDLPVQEELRLVRGELRAQDSRCAEAIADFDAILGDDHLRELHGRANRARARCR